MPVRDGGVECEISGRGMGRGEYIQLAKTTAGLPEFIFNTHQ